LIALDDVSKRYPNGTFALRDVDLRVDAGDFIFLVGASGAGKSTLIRLLIREELATTGRVVVDGEDVGRMARSRVHRLRRKVGVVFQDFKLLPRKTVAENVAFALIVTGHEGRLVREETERALSLVGLTARRDHFPSQLSGGEQQRTAIARSLISNPTLVLADEPTANLDHRTGETVVRMLRDLCSTLGVTVVASTHDPTVADEATRVVRMKDGQIVN
jgi:putative ABC transport system ATP-binding protein